MIALSRAKKLIVLSVVVVVIGFLVYFGPAIMFFVQNPSSSSNASYTRLMIRTPYGYGVNYTTVEFGDTEYNFLYVTGMISIYAPFQSYPISDPEVGHTYNSLGLEIKVENVSSDYLSDYVVIEVKPTVTNYMFSTYRYTKVNLTNCPIIQYGPPLNYSITVNISSGLTNETHQYTFTYFSSDLFVNSSSQTKEYSISTGTSISTGVNGDPTKDFNIEIRVYKIEADYLVIYVKPLY